MNDDELDLRREQFHDSIAYHKVTPDTLDVTETFKELRGAAKKFGDTILDNTGYSREQSLALTHVEDALMWATKQVAINRLPVAE